MSETVEVFGETRSLGLLVPPTRPVAVHPLCSVMSTISRETAKEIITDPSWVPAVEEFGDSFVKDQNGRGACAGYAAASAVERARARRGETYVELSGDGIYAAVNGGRDAGSMLDANMRWLTQNGVPPASLVPRHEYRKNRIPAAAFEAGKRFRGFESYELETEDEMITALVAKIAVVVAVHAGNGGRSPDGLVDWSNGVGNHSVVVDDIRFRNNVFEYQTANSWGLRWGERGRGWLSWNRHFSTPIRYHMFYAVPSTLDDPQGDNPPDLKVA